MRQPVSPVSVNRALTTLRLLFNRAIRSGEFRGLRNPAAEVCRFHEYGSMRVISREEEYRYFAAIKSGDLWDAARLMLETGMRPHEVFGLRLMDVDLRYRIVSVANQVRRTAPVVLGKTLSSVRTVPLSNEAVAAIERRLRRMNGDPLAFLFAGADPRRPRQSMRKAHDLSVKRASISPAFRLYDLRHTFATREAQAGVPLPILAALLGHSSIEMTMRHIHPQEDAKRAAIRKLELVNLAS